MLHESIWSYFRNPDKYSWRLCIFYGNGYVFEIRMASGNFAYLSRCDAAHSKIQRNKTKTILGSISAIIGIVLLASGASKTLTDLGTVYLVGACVMFFGIIQLSTLTKTPKEEETEEPSKKRKKKKQEPEKKKESHKIMIVCCVVSLVIGGLAIYNSFVSFVSVDKLIAYNIVMQGVNVVQIALDTYKKGERV